MSNKMTTVTAEPPAVPELPTSENEFIKSYFALRYRHRPSYLQSLAKTHGEKLLPLIQELLATQPAVHEIPISRPAKKESDLNADGGNPTPIIDTHVLRFPQTNASSRYLQRDAGLTMAIALAHQRVMSAITLLLGNLNHPYQVGKKRLVQCLATLASDEDLLAASIDSAPSVRDSLVSALAFEKRKDLVNEILGKPKTLVIEKNDLPTTTLFRRALEQAKDFDRERVWIKYAKLLDVDNQPGSKTCEPGESLKDVILTLHEDFPPLHPWDDAAPKRRSPKLANIIENSLVTFLRHDATRTMHILQKTSWQIRGSKQYLAHIPAVLMGKKARRLWCRHDHAAELIQNYWLGLVAVGEGELVKRGLLPHGELFRTCRGAAVERLVRMSLALLQSDEFKTLSKSDAKTQAKSLENILVFATAGMGNLVFRVTGCSQHEDRPAATSTFHTTLEQLITLLFSQVTAPLRVQAKDDWKFYECLYYDVLKSLFYQPTTNKRSPGVISRLKSFPPLAQHLFIENQSLFTTKSRTQPVIRQFVKDLLTVLAPRDDSVYTIPNNKWERPYSAVPAWDNSAVFQTCVADCFIGGTTTAIFLDVGWIQHFCALGPKLTSSQRDQIVRGIFFSSEFKTLVTEYRTSVFPMLASLCSNVELRHELLFPLLFPEKKTKAIDFAEDLADWAAYLDIRIPSVRELLVKESIKPAFEDRLKWIAAVLKATRWSGDVKEWILTLKWLLPKIRNEIHPNLVLLAPHLHADDGFVPRQYLDNATLEQATFVDKVAEEALQRFVNSPSHPFYHLGYEIPWRRLITSYGEASSLELYRLTIKEPSYSNAVTERDEQGEILRRQLVLKDAKACKSEGALWGLYRVAEGEEDSYVQGRLNAYHARWLSVKAVMDPEVEGDDLQAFATARKSVWQSVCLAIQKELGWRWKRSPLLVGYVNEVVEALSQASTVTFGPDKVLNWSDYDYLTQSASYVQEVYDIYCNSKWCRRNRDSLSWYTRFREIRLRSTYFAAEIQSRLDDCLLENGKRDRDRYENLMTELLRTSPSAVHYWQITEFVANERPDLLTEYQLGLTKTISGLFNQNSVENPWDFIVKVPNRLEPRQCEVLKKRHLLGMMDTTAAFQTRVQHAQAFVAIPTTAVEDVANALSTPSLPSRIAETLLMYIPTLGEPASTLQILLAPVYIQSHLARTAIHAVENALKCIPLSQVPDFILPLFPPVGKRQQKVTVQKEGIRLVCSNMRLLSNPKVSTLIEDLLAREDLNKDVRVVILQEVLCLLCSVEGREERYKDIAEWIWKTLATVARSETYKASGVALVLLAVNPSITSRYDAPSVLTNQAILRNLKRNVTLDTIARVAVPEVLVNRYVDEVLVPMSAKPSGDSHDIIVEQQRTAQAEEVDDGFMEVTAEDEEGNDEDQELKKAGDTKEDKVDDKDLLEVRTLTLQMLAQTPGWVTAHNASRLAVDWRQQAKGVPLDNDPDNLWILFAAGIALCVGHEVDGAMAAGREGNTAWLELVGLVQDQVDAFMDKTLRRALRQKALNRINSLNLTRNFVFHFMYQAVTSGAFTGDVLDLSRPLLSKGMVSVAWATALEREITVFKPQKGLSQSQINDEALKILLRIADYSNRYLSTASEMVRWVGEKLLTKVKNNTEMKRYIGLALIKPHDDLIDWTHLDHLTLNVLKTNPGIFSLEEIMLFVEKIAKQDSSQFYWTSREAVLAIITAEVQRMINTSQAKFESKVSTITSELTALVQRAETAGWTEGPDASIFRGLMSNHTTTICLAFPRAVGPFLHTIITSQMDAPSNLQLWTVMPSFATYGMQATVWGNPGAVRNGIPESRYGIPPATVMIIEAMLNGALNSLDLTQFTAPHSLSSELTFGLWFPYRGCKDQAQSVDIHGFGRPKTLKEVDARWNRIMGENSGYFKPMEQAVHITSQKSISPAMTEAYRAPIAFTVSAHPKFVLMRPYAFIEFVRLGLTAPGTALLITTAAGYMAKAFEPIKNYSADEFTYAWAPPLGLALDLAEYLLHEVREEAATEGQREAQTIEQLTAWFLKSWIDETVRPHGALLVIDEDLADLELRYNALVEELSEEGSGGQSLALQLPDFCPGGAVESFRE
ncbi:hypothetical protein BGZ98_003511 [Dissophora globulifera]|nr:hypothetical protein BGZ98_003511 [Dissophora globulifera]